ncbi:MAG: hypothetical protein KKC77_19585 [Proteobacteria bacterium]|nr:hypothetical protein [Pseudomonadota bacterium]
MKKHLILICAILVFGGASCEDGRTGGTRTACRIEGGTNGTNTGWFRYYDYMDNPIEQPGLRMTACISGCGYMKSNGFNGLIYVPTDFCTIETTGVTGEGGFCYATGRLTEEGAASNDGHWNGCGAYFQKPMASGCDCSAGLTYNVIPYSRRSNASAEVCNRVPKWVSTATLSMLTEDEQDAVANPNPTLPASGFSYSVQLVQQRGENNAGYAKSMSWFVPSNLNDVDDIFYRSFPVQYSYTVKTAEPIDLIGKVFSSRVKTDIRPQGYVVPITVVAENEEKTVHIARTDFFIPTEPEYFEELSSGGTIKHAVYDRWTPLDTDDLHGSYAWLPLDNPLDGVDPNILNDPNIWCQNRIDGILPLDCSIDLWNDPNLWVDPGFWCDPNVLASTETWCSREFLSSPGILVDATVLDNPKYMLDTYDCDPNVLIVWGEPEFYELVLYTDTNHPRFNEVELPQERILPVYIIPVNAENDELRIEFIPNDELLLIGASEWLGSNKCLDINNDGIVNLKDFFFGF